MTCKDCIKCDVCIHDGFAGGKRKPFDCTHFKDKSRFIELPCRVGDKIWTIIEDEESYFIDDGYVASIANCQDGLWIYSVFECGLTYHYHISRNDSYFFTYEEAEAKLKEMQNDE